MLDYSILFGDGIRDDTDAIQKLLDSGYRHILMPSPAVCYTISRTLRIHSNQTLELPRYATIRLADASDCLMIENSTPPEGNENIAVIGGIWDMNNMGQRPNPIYDGSYREFYDVTKERNTKPYFAGNFYFGVGMRFSNIKGFTLRSLTYKDPVTYAINMGYIEEFNVEDIVFDYNYGNPIAQNMDGIHLDGGCRAGLIRNLKGACYDDLVALNADEQCCGPIEDIEIDGIYSNDCHSAVRLLSAPSPIKRVTISNVFGTFFQYCVGFSKYYNLGNGIPGVFEDITLREIYASKAERYSLYGKDGSYVYPLIWFQEDTDSDNISIYGLHRREKTTAVATIGINKGARVRRLFLADVTQKSSIDEAFPLYENEGEVDELICVGTKV